MDRAPIRLSSEASSTPTRQRSHRRYNRTLSIEHLSCQCSHLAQFATSRTIFSRFTNAQISHSKHLFKCTCDCYQLFDLTALHNRCERIPQLIHHHLCHFGPSSPWDIAITHSIFCDQYIVPQTCRITRGGRHADVRLGLYVRLRRLRLLAWMSISTYHIACQDKLDPALASKILMQFSVGERARVSFLDHFLVGLWLELLELFR